MTPTSTVPVFGPRISNEKTDTAINDGIRHSEAGDPEMKAQLVGGGKSMIVTQPPPKPDPNTYRVLPGKLLAGEYSGARDSEEARKRLRGFLAAGVRHFIDLTEAGELTPYAELPAEEAGSRTSYERFPIHDGNVPEEPKTMTEIIAAIDRAMAEGGIT